MSLYHYVYAFLVRGLHGQRLGLQEEAKAYIFTNIQFRLKFLLHIMKCHIIQTFNRIHRMKPTDTITRQYKLSLFTNNEKTSV